MYSLALIIFVVSEKKAFEYFPIGHSNDHSFTVWVQSVHLAEISKIFFSETNELTEPKL
jgi:predicted membrane channel-forming protein YqfA (hemolysin III family)